MYFSALRSWQNQNSTKGKEILTHECNDEDAKNDPEDVTEDVHDDDGEESHRQVELALPLLVLAPAQNLGKCIEAELGISHNFAPMFSVPDDFDVFSGICEGSCRKER